MLLSSSRSVPSRPLCASIDGVMCPPLGQWSLFAENGEQLPHLAYRFLEVSPARRTLGGPGEALVAPTGFLRTAT